MVLEGKLSSSRERKSKSFWNNWIMELEILKDNLVLWRMNIIMRREIMLRKTVPSRISRYLGYLRQLAYRVEKGVGWSIMDIPSITLFLGLLTRSQPHMEAAWLEGQTHYRAISSKMQIQLTAEDSKVRRLWLVVKNFRAEINRRYILNNFNKWVANKNSRIIYNNKSVLTSNKALRRVIK